MGRIMKFVFLLVVTAIFAASIEKEDARLEVINRNGHSLINITSVNTRSVEACCNDDNLLLCSEISVDPSLLLSGEDINILGSDLVFDSTVEPHGFVYHNSFGDEAVITFNNKTGSMFGSLKTHDDKSYAIEKCHHGHVIKEYDMASFEADQTERSLEPVMKTLENRVEDTTTVVNYSIMFYYTQAFQDTTADIDGFIEQVLAETNQGYINSQIPIRASKFCAEKANVEENSNVLTSFANMKQGSSSKLRNSADAAALLVQNYDWCGMASSFTYNTGNTVSVTKKSCALGYYSFGHEIAHNMGALHNPEVSNNNVFPEGHGHLIALGSSSNSNGYRTILGYYADGHYHRVNYYSNPSVILPDTGTPTGLEGISDNAAVLTKNRFTMAALGDESADCSATGGTGGTGGGRGEIQSPNYPSVYPHNLEETWNLEVTSGQKIMLTFESFDLESHSSCVYDYVKISFGSVEEKYCGSSKPSPIISSGNTMTVVFHSDYSVNRNGFKATWEAVETSGEIKSPNYPAVYPHNLDETWNLEVASGKKIKLTFESFDLESHSRCKYDYVKITFESEEEKYCGSSMPSPIISSGNTMTVVFHSDYSVNRNGFRAIWETVA